MLDGETRSIYWVCSNPNNVQYEHDEKFKEEKNYPQLCDLEVTFLAFSVWVYVFLTKAYYVVGFTCTFSLKDEMNSFSINIFFYMIFNG